MPPDPRSADRTSYYTMKTSGRPQPVSSRSHSHSKSSSQSSFRNGKSSSTPLASPRMPHSVGQPLPPKLSPSVSRVSAQDVRTPSPNYFGLTVEPATDPRDSAVMPRENWSPPTSSVRSFGAAIPKQLPLDANPEFEAFRRQVDVNRGKGGFNLSTSNFGLGPAGGSTASPSGLLRPRPPRWHTHGSDASEQFPRAPSAAGSSKIGDAAAGGRMDVDNDSLHDSAYVSADSKRNSEASLNPPSFLNMGRHESPAQFEAPFTAPEQRRSNLSKVDDRHPRLSMVEGKAAPPTPELGKPQRADTVPPKLENAGGPSMVVPSQLKELIEEAPKGEYILLDLRVSPQYAQSRIKGALNLCIPTTLLKRATFNLEKLQQTFQREEDQEKFANWQEAKYLIVYDAFSSEKRDAVSAMNMIKKFTNEGYSGSTCILRGGFNTFAAAHPQLIDHSSGKAKPGLSLGGSSGLTGSSNIPPVIGGVMLPNAGNNGANPFFANIRQNQDLIDGVGQMDISRPSHLNSAELPRWLRTAAELTDHGKNVSDKFLNIELKEQSRMKNAYSIFSNANTSSVDENIQLSGLEKGGKNRYKDILPFEHARVKLVRQVEGACDYVNASHIKATRSHKRYIASQGPLPATFEDFWSVIWDQDVRVIVMLTAESEGGQLKCHPYWTGREFGAIKLRLLSEKKVSLDIDKHRSDSQATPSTASSHGSSSTSSNQNPFSFGTASGEAGRRRANTTTTLEGSTPTPIQPNLGSQGSASGENPYVIIRKFALSHTAHPFAHIREITQLHYPSWPDFGAPARPAHLLALVELANVMQRAALPIDVPSAIASAGSASIAIPDLGSKHGSSSSNGDVNDSDAQRRSSKASTKRSEAIPLAWYDAPESDSNARPMLVHCSAGCGRTGAFCTVDSVIDMLKRQRLRAVQRANQKIEERERRLAQNRSFGAESGQIDADGDVSMDESTGGDQDDDEDASPLALPRNPNTMFPDPSATPLASNARTPLAGPTSMPTRRSEDGNAEDIDGLDLSWLDDDSVDLIARTVDDFRTQRLSMVQSLRQFVLCYETVIEWIWRLHEKTSNRRDGSIGSVAGGRNRSGSLNVG